MLILCFVPIVLGIVTGVAASSGFIQVIISFTDTVRTYEVAFHFHVMVAIVSLLIAGLTVVFSAWIPAKKLVSYRHSQH